MNKLSFVGLSNKPYEMINWQIKLAYLDVNIIQQNSIEFYFSCIVYVK